MKQIFPGIRPRRLGTRGNSRYCYAAMRKTTKLESPYLPNLAETKNLSTKFGKSSGSTCDFISENVDTNDETSSASWNIIKTWAESLVGTEFHSVNEMAEYISKNYLNGVSSAAVNSSRLLLQKKLLQRKAKGRKKNAGADHTVHLIKLDSINFSLIFSFYRKIWVQELRKDVKRNIKHLQL